MIRVIAGLAKGRRLKTVKGNTVRPTSDKVRGAIFNILGNVVFGADVLDLFSGSGAFGIEALSRGARMVVFVDNDIRCVNVIKDNLKECGFSGRVIRRDVYKVIKTLKSGGEYFDIVFADPPYGSSLTKNLLLELEKSGILKSFSIVVIEHSKWDNIEDSPSWLRIQSKRYGNTVVSVYRYER